MQMPRYTLPVAVHVILQQHHQILLVRRCNTGFEDGNYGFPGGHIEPGEPVSQTAIRECQEELGITLAPADLHPIGVSHYTSPTGDGVDFFFKTASWSGEPQPISECDHLLWCAPDTLPANTIPFIQWAVQHHFLQGQWFDESGWST